jgi:serine/threonine protein kinase/tetratricopeptide (TPR) repeat protein
MNEREHFLAALDLDAGQRTRYLDAACGADRLLRQRLDKLLKAHDQASGFLEKPAHDLADWTQAPDSAAGVQPGTEETISHPSAAAAEAGLRYRVLRPHARGGLGEVFVAEDTELHREVALKEIRKEYAQDHQRRGRFVLEAEITGGLEHPGIVPIYGLGQHEDGRPFYAMRLIRGDNLKEAIEKFHQAETAQRAPGERNVAFRELLGRFVAVCNAVAYAHSRGVLHRDLKPGNVMLGKYGETLVVDWGLAKPLGKDEGGRMKDEERPETDSGSSFILHPSSFPATRLGTAVGTPAFMSPEQAAGRRDLLGPSSDIYSLGATLYVVLTGQAAYTGESAEILRKVQRGDFRPPRHIKPDIPPALEAVCLKAMALETEDRYGTALQLAEDIQHWLADEPVSAFPEPVTVRMQRWARQHKPVVSGAAAALLVGALALAAGVFWYQQDQAERYAQQVRHEAQQARHEAQARQELAQALDLHRTLHRKLAEQEGVRRLLNDPERWAVQLQQVQLHLDKALALATQAGAGPGTELSQQLDSLKEQLQQDEADRRLAVRLEKIRMDRSVFVEGKFNDVQAGREYPRVFAAAGLDMAVGQKAPAPVSARIARSAIKEQLVAALDDWALVAWTTKDVQLCRRLLAVAQAADPDPWRKQVRALAPPQDAVAMQALADKLLAAPEALSKQSPQLLDLMGGLLGSTGGDAARWLRQAQAQHPTDFWLSYHLAVALHKTGPEEAAGYCRAALAMRPESTAAWNNLGMALHAHKDLPGATAAYHKALKLDPQNATAWNNLGNTLRAQQDLSGAVAAYQKALKIKPHYATAWNNLGVTLDNQQDLPGAIVAYHKALKLDPQHATAWYNLGNALRAQPDLPGAVAAYQRALKIKPHYATAWNNLGVTLDNQQDLPGAIAAYHKALKLDPQDAHAWHNLGLALYAQGDFAQAHQAALRALELHPKAQTLRASARKWLQVYQQALQKEQRALKLVEGKAPPGSSAELLQLAQFCRRFHRPYTAARLYTAAFTAQPGLTEDLAKEHRYHAACAAVLAAAGQGLDAKPLPDKDRTELRRQALDWLRADLEQLTKTVADQLAPSATQKQPPVSPLEKLAGQSHKPAAAGLLLVCDRLQRWQQDPELASVCEDTGLAKLPPQEQKDWRPFWDEVRALDQQARASAAKK